ncbi:MAG: hypothetical protein AAF986_11760, partial [Pseudomonadota bacterium]
MIYSSIDFLKGKCGKYDCWHSAMLVEALASQMGDRMTSLADLRQCVRSNHRADEQELLGA